jgi:hypothetical protein
LGNNKTPSFCSILSFLDSRSDRGWRIPPGRGLFIIS